MFHKDLFAVPIVIENGSFETRFGYGGDAQPRIMTPTAAACTKGSVSTRIVGDDAMEVDGCPEV